MVYIECMDLNPKIECIEWVSYNDIDRMIVQIAIAATSQSCDFSFPCPNFWNLDPTLPNYWVPPHFKATIFCDLDKSGFF